MEINRISPPIRPEVPKVLDNEQLNVYVPFATELYAGIAMYNMKHFEFSVPGMVSLHPDVVSDIDYSRKSIDNETDNTNLVFEDGEYRNKLLETPEKQIIPAINRHEGRIGNGDIESPIEGDVNTHNLVALANSTKRYIINFVNNTYAAHIVEFNRHKEEFENEINRINEVDAEQDRRICDNETDIINIFDTIGGVKDDLNTEAKTLVGGINEVDAKSKDNSRRIAGLDVRIQGIGKTYVVQTFLDFIEFINGRLTVTVNTDEDGDGVLEEKEIDIADLKTGDNVLIAETYVPDFWFEKTTSIANAGEYDYIYTDEEGNKVTETFDLIGMKDGQIQGLFYQLEARYIVGDVLPIVTAEDDGKFLRVINGEWNVAEVLNAEEYTF